MLFSLKGEIKGGNEQKGLFSSISGNRLIMARLRHFLEKQSKPFSESAIKIIRESHDKSDITILTELQAKWTLIPEESCFDRGKRRIKFMPKFYQWEQSRRDDLKYLDIGAAEGCITGAMAAHMKIKKENAIACDITEQAQGNNFIFIKVNGKDLPFQNDHFDLATMFMSAHHFEDPKAVFSEVFRVMKPGGLLLMREHGRADDDSVAYYNVIHAFYEVIAKREVTAEQFLNASRPQYRTCEQWKQLMEPLGFKLINKDTNMRDSFDAVYMLYSRQS